MFDKVRSWVSGSDGGDHPLDRPKEDHLAKKREAEQKLDRLRDRRDELKEAIEEKKRQYKQAKQSGNEERAKDHLRDAESIKDDLETVRGRIDEVSQQRNLASNMVNVHEMRASHDDAYWQRLKEMDRDELIRGFSEREMEVDEMVGMLQEAGEMGSEAVSSYRQKTSDMHGTSELEEEWEEESTAEEATGIDPNDVFDLDESEETEESSPFGEEYAGDGVDEDLELT